MRLPKLRSVRFILTLWSSLLIMGAVAVFGASVYFYLERFEDQALSDMLIEEVDWIHQIVEIERQQLSRTAGIDALSRGVESAIIEHFAGNPRNFIVALTTDQGQLLYQSGSRAEEVFPLPAPPRDTTFVRPADDHTPGQLRVAVRRASPFVIQVGFPSAVGGEVLSRLLTIFSILTPVVIFLALAGGWFITGAILNPLQRISHAAKRITAENLGERIPPRAVDDELGELITTMNGMIARLQESFGQLRQFLMNVAHELRTPLTILKGESELALSRDLTQDEAREILSSHLRESVRMSRIVDDLLLLAKAEAGQIPVEKGRVRLDRLLADLQEDALILAIGQELTVTLGPNPALEVEGDQARLRQLFRILLTNAVQYTEPGGTIRIESGATDREAEVHIIDSGIGIPADSLERIFEPFYRTDDARGMSHSGSGLGLPIARWIAQSHRGSIRVRSEIGSGSRFTVVLPLWPDSISASARRS